MAKFAVFFSYTPAAWQKMMTNPSDRRAAAREVGQGAGATLESMYFMFGEFDGMAIYDAPDSAAAGAISIAINSTGAFTRAETHELIETDALPDILGTAKAATTRYTPPGG